MSRPHPALLRLAESLIAAGVLFGLLAFATRAMDTRDAPLRLFEAGALLSAAAAFLAQLASHRPSLRELVLRSGLVAAFVLWAVVQLEPSIRGAALLNDAAIVLS